MAPVPGEPAPRLPAEERSDSAVPLRLTVTRGRLGLELYEGVTLGPLRVEHLALSFDGLKFPLDLSGGVPVFRHRRGSLERLVLSAELEDLRRWAEPRLRPAFGPLVRPLDLWWLEGGIGVGLVREGWALAFDVLWAPEGPRARWVVARPRGWGLRSPALGEALRAVDSLLRPPFQRSGRFVELDNAGGWLGRRLLPAVGARAPSARSVVFGPLRFADQRVRAELDATLLPFEANLQVARALELAQLVYAADDALAQGELDQARASYLLALEKAPRHPEVVLLIADIDRLGEQRHAAALELVTETMPAVAAGAVGAELLGAAGDLTAAAEALRRAAEEESYPPLSALWSMRQAQVTDDILERLSALDAAVARAPTLAEPRWERMGWRARRGDVSGALADAEHLEAAAKGSAQRHQVARRAAQLLLDAGLERDAGRLFQRALRYLPDDADAVLGLGRALAASGASRRALPLLRRAVELLEREGRLAGAPLLELSRLIARQLGDLPQAIARLRQIRPEDPSAAPARALEAQYRCRLGDLVGASVAYARLRELAELGQSFDGLVDALLDAARFERDVLVDLAASERHLAVALRLAPNDHRVRDLYRAVAAAVVVRNRRASGGGANAQDEPSLSPDPAVDEKK